MKPRVVRAHQILAIALSTTAAACAPGVGATSGGAAGPRTAAPEIVVAPPEPTPALADTASPGAAAVLADTASPVAAAALADTVAAAAPAGSVPVADSLLRPRPPQPRRPRPPKIRSSWRSATRSSRRGRGACPTSPASGPSAINDGYPLVGNVVRGKSGPAQPSAFCANVRGPAVR